MEALPGAGSNHFNALNWTLALAPLIEEDWEGPKEDWW